MGGAIPGGGPAGGPGGAAVATGAGAVSGVPQAWQYRLPSGF